MFWRCTESGALFGIRNKRMAGQEEEVRTFQVGEDRRRWKCHSVAGIAARELISSHVASVRTLRTDEKVVKGPR
jgi:hypothetical protein